MVLQHKKKVSPASWDRRSKYPVPPLKSPGQDTENLSNLHSYLPGGRGDGAEENKLHYATGGQRVKIQNGVNSTGQRT